MIPKENAIILPPYVSDILSRLESAGFSAYAVGGCVRDSLLGLPVHDWDVCTEALPEQSVEVFKDYRVIPTGIQHGTVSVVTECGTIEVTTFRTDGDYGDHRHPEQVSFTRILTDDLSRRDFTVNAMACGLSGEVVDAFGGCEDLKREIIRCVGEPSVRFGEDALRILRMYRFAYRLDFSIDTDTRQAAAELNALVPKLSRERITQEFGRILCGPNAFAALSAMEKDGVLQHILPSPLKIARELDALSPDLRVRLAFSLSLHNGDRICEIMKGSRYSVREVKDVSEVAELIASPPPRSGAEVKRVLKRYGMEVFEVYLSVLKVIDPDVHKKAAAEYSSVIARGECYSLRDLRITGHEVRAFGVSGKQVGDLLDMLLEHVIDSPGDNTNQRLREICEKAVKQS
ncbi:MAG: CCA tRNA nucleotidyltransferase [Eubacteriales bacterium]